MGNKHHIIYWVAIVLACLLTRYCVSNSDTQQVEKTIVVETTDTLRLTDTLRMVEPKYITKRVVDTMWVDVDITDSVVGLPLEEKHYSEPNLYDIWISGVEPSLDSVSVYQRTEYITTTKEITKEIYPQTLEWYGFAGLNVFNGTLCPKIGVSLKTKKDWIVSPEIGLYDKSVFYGVTIGKKFK